tara:strand:+ start:356 stop:700 length:345 start_codon:yes stop_codon:yes gene_type:complete
MARPKGSKNKPKIVSTSDGLINLGGGVPATPETPTVEATSEKRVALGRVNIEKLFRASAGQMTVHESQNGNIVFKGRCVDENGITYMTTMLMPLNPTTGKAMKASEVDISSLIG